MNFSEKKKGSTFFNIPIIYHLAKNQKKLMNNQTIGPSIGTSYRALHGTGIQKSFNPTLTARLDDVNPMPFLKGGGIQTISCMHPVRP